MPRNDPSGFEEFIERVIAEETAKGRALDPERPAWSTDLLRQLVGLAFQASVSTYEGVHPRFTLALRDVPAEQDTSIVIRFGAPQALTLGQLRDLARVVPPYPMALSVRLAGELTCVGVANLHAQVAGEQYPLSSDRARLTVHVSGPAELAVGIMGSGWQLKGGSARRIEHFAYTRPVHQLAERACGLRLSADIGEPRKSITSWLLREALGGAVRHLCALGRGGAFLITPDDSRGLEITRRALGTSDLVALVADWQQLNWKDPSVGELAEHAVFRSKVATVGQSLGYLAALDGCVVFSPDLQLAGFGAKMLAKERPDRCVECDLRGNRVSEFDLTARGTRHGSAAAYVHSLPESVAIVVSQDGGIRVFSSLGNQPLSVTRECEAPSGHLTAPA